MPVTSSSREAIELYNQGIDFFDRIQTEKARELFGQAVRLDPDFAMAHLGLASTSDTYQEYYDSLETAVKAAAGASDGERWQIEGMLHATNGDPKSELSSYRRLVATYPDDERAHDLIGNWYFVEQDFEKAIEHCRRATELAPEFSSPYNNLGYAHEALGNYEAAERAFLKYIELIPEDPNPYDSYGELLMKMGRYEESIETYRKALEKDGSFYSSYLGVGHNQIFLDRIGEARATFEMMRTRVDGYLEQQEALLGLASADLAAGDISAALKRLQERRDLAKETGDPLEVSSDTRLIAQFQLEQGNAEQAVALYDEAEKLFESADVSLEVRERQGRNRIYREAVLAAAVGDIDFARERANEYVRKVALYEGPSEIRRGFALEGEISLASGDYSGALSNLAQSDQSNPRILWLQALAAKRSGDEATARYYAERVVEFNEPTYGYALYRERAKEILR